MNDANHLEGVKADPQEHGPNVEPDAAIRRPMVPTQSRGHWEPGQRFGRQSTIVNNNATFEALPAKLNLVIRDDSIQLVDFECPACFIIVCNVDLWRPMLVSDNTQAGARELAMPGRQTEAWTALGQHQVI